MDEGERPITESVAPGAITALLRDALRAPREQVTRLPVFRSGQVIGRFELVRKLGHGGFGVVYEAFDRTLKRAVAFKAVRLGGDVELKEERLLREAEAAAQLSHPNIVTLHDVGQSDEGPYLVLELLRGRTVGERLRDGPMSPGEALGIATQIAKGVAHAHARGVVHRDVTPGNVFLCDDGQVKVLDFGMAAFGRHKVEGGTVAYMAPEQWNGTSEDERTDVFALGVVLHEMITGRRPFRAPAELTGSDAAPGLDLPGWERLAELIARMLAKDPLDRPRDCGEVLAALTAVQQAPETQGGRAHASRGWWSTRRIVAVAAPSSIALVAVAIALARGNAARSSTASDAPRAAPVSPSAPSSGSRPARAVAPPAPIGIAASLHPKPERPTPPARPARPERASAAVRFCRDSIDSVPTPQVATGDGVLTIVADPFAAVFVNGRPYGDTPSECRLAAGTYAVRAVHPALGEREAQVRVDAGERASWAADFASER